MEINILDLIAYILGTVLIFLPMPKNAELEGLIYFVIWFFYSIVYFILFVWIDYNIIDLIGKIGITL